MYEIRNIVPGSIVRATTSKGPVEGKVVLVHKTKHLVLIATKRGTELVPTKRTELIYPTVLDKKYTINGDLVES